MTKKKRDEKKLQKVIVLVLVFLLLVLGFRCSYLGEKEKKTSSADEQIHAIEESDYSNQQEVLNTIVEQGKMNVNYSSKAVFHGVISEKFNVKNIKNNHYPIVFELYDEENHRIYVSGEIAPGYEMTGIKLQKELKEGTHECKLKIGYTQEGNVSSVFPITIEVR